jgi:phage-related holin
MKTTSLLYMVTTFFALIGTYFFKLGADNAEQYLAVVSVIMIDGFFGIWAGSKTEGFQTKKAVKVLTTLFVWILILTGVLLIEKGFPGTSWLSETVCAPFILFQLISALKNAKRAGLIENELLTIILEKIDTHKIQKREEKES